jgi:hypothetical protein
MPKTYCNRHYGFYETHEGCTYCLPSLKAPANPLSQGEIIYAESIQEFWDKISRLLLPSSNIYLNAWTWDKFLTEPRSDLVLRPVQTGVSSDPIGYFFGCKTYLHEGLHNREVRVVHQEKP